MSFWKHDILHRIEKLEFLDEVDLLDQLLSHYCISWAFNDDKQIGNLYLWAPCGRKIVKTCYGLAVKVMVLQFDWLNRDLVWCDWFKGCGQYSAVPFHRVMRKPALFRVSTKKCMKEVVTRRTHWTNHRAVDYFSTNQNNKTWMTSLSRHSLNSLDQSRDGRLLLNQSEW